MHGRVEMEWKLYGDGSETGWRRVGVEIKSVGGCNFVPMQTSDY